MAAVTKHATELRKQETYWDATDLFSVAQLKLWKVCRFSSDIVAQPVAVCCVFVDFVQIHVLVAPDAKVPHLVTQVGETYQPSAALLASLGKTLCEKEIWVRYGSSHYEVCRIVGILLDKSSRPHPEMALFNAPTEDLTCLAAVRY